MKIGIMTFWWSNDNYGQLLQCYALQKYLQKIGHNAFVIRYRVQKKKLIHYIIKAFDIPFFIKWIFNKTKVKAEQKAHNRHFDDFRHKYIRMSEKKYNSIEQLRSNPPEADAYIVGSDQVWNTFHNRLKTIKMRIHAYFLDFGEPETKRLSYAASWGSSELPYEFKSEITPLLKRFNYVSVREENGLEICLQCGCTDAEWVCDPTLLLDADDYRSLYKEENLSAPNQKYIFLYLLKNLCALDIKAVFEFAKEKNLKVIYVTGNGRVDEYEKTFATLPEWLCYVDNAEYVITNSFHCSVFCTIFHKQFAVSRICGKNNQTNTRFDSLFLLRGCGNRYLTDDFSVLDQPYKIKEINVSQKFLKTLKE